MKLLATAAMLAVTVVLAAAGAEGKTQTATLPDFSDEMRREEFVSLCWLRFTENPKVVTAVAEVKAWMAQRRHPSRTTCMALLNTRFDCFTAMFHLLPPYTILGAIDLQTFCFALHKGKIQR